LSINISEEEFIQNQTEQQKQDQHDLKLFEEIKNEETAAIKKARRQYSRLVKKYMESLT
jgi:hypothetical protein